MSIVLGNGLVNGISTEQALTHYLNQWRPSSMMQIRDGGY